MIDLEKTTVNEIADYFSNEVNNLLFKPDRIAEEQRDSKQMKDLDILWIKVLSSSEYRTDLRNEAAARVGKKLAEIPFVKRKIDILDNQKMQKVAEKMSQEHKTLQRTFSVLTFYHFLQICNEKEAKELTAVMGESFYRLPLI